ncbi:type II secretion system protein GspM [Pseudomonas sp. PGPR40]|uniref:type II secretion system protein GspM n=1 Tax=Pseudomonas sp. PGPR40 TaxID=2913476 RepID=UPI001EDBF259|nr:type II secretion system protein GspM [Pseudomonas sp. PGPR40]
MKTAWQRLSIREQRLLLAMGAFLLAVVAFSLIWQPTRQRLETVEREYQQQLALTAQLQRAQPQRIARTVADQPLSLRVSESTTAAGLELHQMEADNDLLRLTLSGDAKALLQWLDHAEREGAALQSLTLEKRDVVLEARVVLR